MCVLGERLLKDIPLENCTKDIGSPLYDVFCTNATYASGCDPYFDKNNVTMVRGIKGLASGVFFGKQRCEHIVLFISREFCLNTKFLDVFIFTSTYFFFNSLECCLHCSNHHKHFSFFLYKQKTAILRSVYKNKYNRQESSF